MINIYDMQPELFKQVENDEYLCKLRDLHPKTFKMTLDLMKNFK